jgi:hypothetical protein
MEVQLGFNKTGVSVLVNLFQENNNLGRYRADRTGYERGIDSGDTE